MVVMVVCVTNVPFQYFKIFHNKAKKSSDNFMEIFYILTVK